MLLRRILDRIIDAKFDVNQWKPSLLLREPLQLKSALADEVYPFVLQCC